MVNVTITTSATTFTFGDGEVSSIVEEITAQPDSIPMPASPPASTILLDLGGATKKITISGILFDDGTDRLSTGTAITLLAQKQWLEGLIDGAQSTVTFTSNYSSKTSDGDADPDDWEDTSVVVSTLRFTETEGKPSEIEFTMTLMAGTG